MNIAMILGLGLQISLFLVVLSFGLQATLDDLLYLFRRPGQLVRALISINVIMPVFAILLVTLFNLNPVIEIALVALAVSPVPPVLPNKAFKSGGSRAFTFGLLAAVSLLAVIVIPMTFRILDAIFDRHANFSEAVVMKTILTGMVIPLVTGMVIRYFAPGFSERVARIIGKIGMIVLIIAFLPILLALLPVMWSLVGNGTILAIIAFAIVGITVGHFLGGPDQGDRTVLAIATAARHPAIAIALESANVGETEPRLAAAAVVLYVLVSGIVATPYLAWLTGDRSHKEVQA